MHLGHKALLAKAFEIGDYVYIGLTTDAYVNKVKGSEKIPGYSERESALRKFVEKFGKRFEIVPLSDKFGPSIKADFDVIVVSDETIKAAREINRLREENGFEPLTIIKIDYVLAADSKPISTTRIDNGEIDNEGNLIH